MLLDQPHCLKSPVEVELVGDQRFRLDCPQGNLAESFGNEPPVESGTQQGQLLLRDLPLGNGTGAGDKIHHRDPSGRSGELARASRERRPRRSPE